MNTDDKSKNTRRRFLVVAGGAVACCGLTALSSQQPPIEFVRSDCGGENEMEVTAYSDAAREVVQPVDVGLFAGAMDYGKLSLPFRLIMKGMKIPEGDFRDWDVIHAWANDVQPRVLEA